MAVFGMRGAQHVRIPDKLAEKLVKGAATIAALSDPARGADPRPPRCVYCGNPRYEIEKKCPGCGAREVEHE